MAKYQSDIYNLISQMKSDSDSLVDRFNDYDACEKYLELHFSHLEPTTNNIFSSNEQLCGLVPGLH